MVREDINEKKNAFFRALLEKGGETPALPLPERKLFLLEVLYQLYHY